MCKKMIWYGDFVHDLATDVCVDRVWTEVDSRQIVNEIIYKVECSKLVTGSPQILNAIE